MKIFTLAVGVLLSMFGLANAQEYDFEGAKERLTKEVAGAFYDPGPTLVEKVLGKMEYGGHAPDLGMNLTSLTTYQIGEVLFGADYARQQTKQDDGTALAQFVIIRNIRDFLANPNNLTGLWYQVKSTAVPVLLNKVGQTRVNAWLSPAASLFAEGGFNPTLGKLYEEWRTGGCQWYLQISPDPGYTPKMGNEECAAHVFVKALGGENAKADTDFVNMAHWYGFLWRRYLEGDAGLVGAWQSILHAVTKAAAGK